MLKQELSPIMRGNTTVTLDSDLVVVGGGMAGTCAAITAARNGIKVILMETLPIFQICLILLVSLLKTLVVLINHFNLYSTVQTLLRQL
jgi:heterodisulfide reductase subunit A-like polyferredoxin